MEKREKNLLFKFESINFLSHATEHLPMMLPRFDESVSLGVKQKISLVNINHSNGFILP